MLSILTLLLTAPTASAHSYLESSTPSKDSSIETAPANVVLQFNEPLDTGFTALTVIGPDGASQWTGGAPVIAGQQLSAPLKPLGRAGKYTVNYRIVSADGHPVSGAFAFTLTSPGPATATPAPAATGQPGSPSAIPVSNAAAQSATGGGLPAWPWIAGAALLLLLGAAVAVHIGRGPGHSDR